MTDDQYLVLDDARSALCAMSELGRQIAAEPVERVREATRRFAARRRWAVVNHNAYAAWAVELARSNECRWLVLDPLFPCEAVGSQARRLRVSRAFDNNEAVVTRRFLVGDAHEAVRAEDTSGPLGLVDDTAVSGSTLRHVLGLTSALGAIPCHIVLCAAARDVRVRLKTLTKGAQWSEFVRGSWLTFHLRDGCPFLPFSGRPTGRELLVGGGGSRIALRVPVSSVLGHPWQVLLIDSEVRAAVRSAFRDVVAGLSAALGRSALAGDLCLLGSCVPLVSSAVSSVTHNTTLASLPEMQN